MYSQQIKLTDCNEIQYYNNMYDMGKAPSRTAGEIENAAYVYTNLDKLSTKNLASKRSDLNMPPGK